MEGSTDRGLFGFGHKKEEEKHQHGTTAPHETTGTYQSHGYEGGQQQPIRTEGYSEQYGTGHGTGHHTEQGGFGGGMRPGHGDASQTYSAAPGVGTEPEHMEGEGKKHGGLMGKIEDTAAKLKPGHKKSGSSSSSSSDEETEGGKKKHGIF